MIRSFFAKRKKTGPNINFRGFFFLFTFENDLIVDLQQQLETKFT